mmetsp:Transcript_38194/g.63015  ORF Transcript_38194/g.63015 Transcript_38194/m.63015 type:complete len:200 (+) Transcript_38194:1970-2569(+)
MHGAHEGRGGGGAQAQAQPLESQGAPRRGRTDRVRAQQRHDRGPVPGQRVHQDPGLTGHRHIGLDDEPGAGLLQRQSTHSPRRHLLHRDRGGGRGQRVGGTVLDEVPGPDEGLGTGAQDVVGGGGGEGGGADARVVQVLQRPHQTAIVHLHQLASGGPGAGIRHLGRSRDAGVAHFCPNARSLATASGGDFDREGGGRL